MLENLMPQDVFHYFEEICSMPHGSGNVQKISDYLVNFAKEHSLEYRQDAMGNVIIIKEASAGMEDVPALIIQGHMDMVAVKDADCSKDLETEGLDLEVDGDFLFAKGTSLGGDDGIAVAYALALLAGDNYVHPRLEVVVTVDEEIGLLGAAGIDLSGLKGKILLNIDSEKEGELTVACAGGLSLHATSKPGWVEKDAALYEICLNGLTGGHSGTEIGKKSANANKLLMETLYVLGRECDISIYSAKGGTKDNVIPSSAVAVVACGKEEKQIEAFISFMNESLQEEWKGTDPELSLSVKKLSTDSSTVSVLDGDSYYRYLAAFMELPNGVQKMNPNLEGLVQTSLNLGIIELENKGDLSVTVSLRSSVSEEKEELAKKVEAIFEKAEISSTREGEYPAWEYKEDSIIREKMVSIYKKLYKKEPVVLSIHAGLECGILSQKIEGLDCISFGPDLNDIHTTSEKLSISSTKRTWEYLLEVVKTR